MSRTFLEGKGVIIDLMKTGTLLYAFHPSFQVKHPDNFRAVGFAASLIAPEKLSLLARSPQQQAGDLLHGQACVLQRCALQVCYIPPAPGILWSPSFCSGCRSLVA